jgi:hypothetical protein
MLRIFCKGTSQFHRMHTKFFRLYLCSIFLPLLGFSQTQIDEADLFFPVTYWGISLTPTIMSKAKISGNTAKYNISSNPQVGAEVMIDYYYNFSKNTCLVFSGGGSVLGFNFNNDINKNMFSPTTGGNISANKAAARNMDIFYFRFQAAVQKIVFKGLKRAWVISTGLAVLYSLQNSEEINYNVAYPDNVDLNYLNRYQNNNNGGKPWVNVHLTGGRQWMFNNCNAIQLKLKVNYSPISFLKGTYSFDVGNEPSLSGDYKVSGSYIGLNFSYILSRSHKTIK